MHHDLVFFLHQLASLSLPGGFGRLQRFKSVPGLQLKLSDTLLKCQSGGCSTEGFCCGLVKLRAKSDIFLEGQSELRRGGLVRDLLLFKLRHGLKVHTTLVFKCRSQDNDLAVFNSGHSEGTQEEEVKGKGVEEE